MRALLAYERTLCRDCGQDRHRSMNPDMNGQYGVSSHTCLACSALETERGKKDRPKGIKDFIVDQSDPADELMPFQLDLTPNTE